MAYLLLLPISFYTILGTMVFFRQPRSTAHVVLALYALSASVATSGYMVMATTSRQFEAENAVWLIVGVSSWAYVVFLPLTLLGLYFESWLRAHLRSLILSSIFIAAVTDVGLMLLIKTDAAPLVQPTDPGYVTQWRLGNGTLSTLVGITLVILSQIGTVTVLGAAVLRGRLGSWRWPVAFLSASVLSIVIPLLSSFSAEELRLTIAATGFLPPIIVITLLVRRSYHDFSLEHLLSTANGHNDGLIVLDAQRHVVWMNTQIEHWLGSRRLNILGPTHIYELVHGTPLILPIQHILDSDESSDEVEIMRNGEEYVLRVDLRPLEPVRGLQHGQLVRVQDVTTSRIRRNLAERSRELMALNTVSVEISSSLEMDQVIERTLQQALTITLGTHAVVYLIDRDDSSRLILAGNRSADGVLIEAPLTNVLDNSTAGDVVQTRQTILVADTAINSSIHAHRLAEAGWQAGCSLPLIARDCVIGTLQIGFDQPHTFNPVETALLESIGRQMAVALENARLHLEERTQRRLAETLREVMGVLSRENLDETLYAMLELLRNILDYDSASMLLLDGPDSLRIGASIGFEMKPDDPNLKNVRITISKRPYLAAIFETGQAQIVTDTTGDTQWVPGRRHYGSWIGVPLVARDHVRGCMSIAHNQRNRFTPADLQLASTFADQAIIAIENTRLFALEQQRRVQAEILQQTSYNLVTSPNLNSALSTALEFLSKLLAFDRAHIGLLDGDTWVIPVSYPADESIPPMAHVPLADYPLIQQIITDKRPLLAADTRNLPGWKVGRFARQEVRCWLGTPLIAQEHVIGVLNIDSYQPGAFSDEQSQITQVFANQIAATIENFRLRDETYRQNQILRAINTILTTSNEALTRDNLLEVTLKRVLETLDLDGGMIHQRDSASGTLHLRAASGIPDDVVTQNLTLNGEPDLAQTADYPLFSVPLMAHGTEIGLLSIHHPTLTPDLHELLARIGQQLGVVMENATLFENVVRRQVLSVDMGRLSLALSAQLDRDNVLELVCRESLGIFDVQGAYIWLLEDDHLVAAKGYGPGAETIIGSTCALDDMHLLPVRSLNEWRPAYANHVRETNVLSHDFIEKSQAQAVLVVPMLRGDAPSGVIVLVHTQDPDAFSDWITEQIGVIGVHAALAIQNASLFDEIRRRLDQIRLVNEVGRYATAILNPQSLIEGVARKLFDTLGYDLVGVLQVQGGQLIAHSVFERERTALAFSGQRLNDNSVAVKAVQIAEPVLESRPCLFDVHDKECSSLAVPLIMADEVIGVLLVENEGRDSLTNDDLDVLEPLGAQLAVTVSNAGLFEKIRQHTLELETRVNERTTEIRRQKERTEAILRSVADAVIVFNMQGQVILTNPVAKRLFDQHDLEMDLGARIHSLIERTLNAGSETADLTEIIELGNVTLQAKAACVVEDFQIRGSVVVLRDISVLQELDRMKDMFVSNVSHELRTPLANIKLYLSLLKQGRPERRANYLDVMEREIERLARLIDELLHLSRLASEQRAERPPIRVDVDLEDLITTVLQNHMALAESEHKSLRHESLSAPLPHIWGNPDQITRALTNLVGNAINYTPEGGSVLVRSRIEPPEHEIAEWVIIDITDTGIGIPAHELTMIFERFYRGSNVQPNISGTGLGLAIIKEIVELHGGSIVVQSVENQGSTFQVKLPVGKPHTEASVGEMHYDE